MSSEENGSNMGSTDLGELDSLFGDTSQNAQEMNKVILSQSKQNLEGFASCFPEWDLFPPTDV